MTGGGSVVVRRQLGSKLRQLRLKAGKDVADVTEAGLGSKAKISRIETGKGPVKVADIRTLCWLYGADQATTDALAALAPGTQQEDWWEAYGGAVVPGWYSLYAGLEAAASTIRCFEPQVVHGLLQTPEYARAILSADPRLSSGVVDQRVRFRLERKRIQGDLTVILKEAALKHVAGSPEITAAQIEHLRHVDATVLVLPFDAVGYPVRGSFALLDFTDEEDPSVAYVEGTGGAHYYDRPDSRADFDYVWKTMYDKSIPIKEWT